MAQKCEETPLDPQVLLVGVEDEYFLVKDPARKEDCLLLPCDDVDCARRALGTDEDLLLVPLNGPTPTVPEPGVPPNVVRLAYAASRIERGGRNSRASERTSRRSERRSRSVSPNQVLARR